MILSTFSRNHWKKKKHYCDTSMIMNYYEKAQNPFNFDNLTLEIKVKFDDETNDPNWGDE